jgi:hypothetical protein
MMLCLRAVCAIVLALVLASPAHAQVLYGSLVGTATDSSGAAVAGAEVTATNKATGQVRQAQTNEVGQYSFVAVLPGPYEVKVTKEGFRTVTDTSVEVTANNTTRIDLSLPVGSVNEAITVEATSASLQTDSATVKNEVTSRELINVPVPVGRNYQNLLVTIPGFAPPRNAHSVPTNPSRALESNVNGAPRSGVNVRIDGASSIQVWLPHITAYVPSLEAIETVNVATNSFSAEQGLAGGAAINVQIKSGTNDIHGSLFYYNNNNALIAKPFTFGLNNQQNQRNPKYIFNQPGGTIGGPIVRNKLFFFAAYEASLRREFANNQGTLPTAAMRNGDLSEAPNIYGAARGVIYDPATGDPATGAGRTPFAGNIIPQSRISPIARQITGFIPTNVDPTFRESNFFAQDNFLFDRHTIDTKINFNVSERWTMYGRYSVLDYNMQNPGMLGELIGPPVSAAGGNVGTATGRTHSFTYSSTYVIKPNLIFDGNFGYTNFQSKVEQAGLDQNIGSDVLRIPGTNGSRRFEGGWPRFTFAGFTTMGVPDAFMPYERRDPQYQYVGNFNWTKGRHQIRFGADFYKQDLNHLQAEFAGSNHGAQGGFNFTGGPTQIRGGAAATPFNSWASFLLGEVNNYGRLLQVPDTYGTRTWLFSGYLQDTWQVNQKLTVNMGLRYENFPMPRREDRGMERYDFANNKMLVCGVGSVPTNCGTKNSNLLFAPRLGIAYRPNDKTVIRTGFGINWDPLNLIRALRTNYPLLVILNSPATDAFVPVSKLSEGIPNIPNPDIGNGVIDIPRNYALTSTGDEFRRAYIMSWNFTIQRQLPKNFTLQAGYVANRTVRQTGFLNLNVSQEPGTNIQSSPIFQQFGRTVQTALVTPTGHTKYDSLQTQLTKRFSDGLNMTIAYTFSKAIGICCNSNNDGGPAISAPRYYNLNRSLTDFDRPHNFQANFVYELPFGKGKPFASTGFGRWVLGGWQVNGLASLYSGSPFSVTADGAGLNMPGSTQRADQVGPVRKLGNYGRGQSYYDWLSFRSVTNAAGQQEARFGTAGFHTLRGPRIMNLDLGLFRRFDVSERWNLQFRAELLNATNTPQLANPSNNISGLRLNPDGTFAGGVFEVTGTANTGRDGLVQRALRLGVRIGF